MPVDQLVAGDNASLSIMHDTIVFSLLKGTADSEQPWVSGPIKFICPVPGYDRHFALCEQFGIEMVPVPLGDHGPDLDAVRELVADDASVKGMWIVPTYANPTGSVYTEDVVQALVEMPTAAPDFRLFWDNAYAVHHLTEVENPAIDILGPGRGRRQPEPAVRLRVDLQDHLRRCRGVVLRQLAGQHGLVSAADQQADHRPGQDQPPPARPLPEGLRRRTRADAPAPRPARAEVRAGDLDPAEPAGRATASASWTSPEGGYFVSLDVVDGTASRVVSLAKAAGIALTGAGAAFPYGRDPRDRNIRLAPSLPPAADVAAAIEGVCTCVLLAATEQLLAD